MNRNSKYLAIAPAMAALLLSAACSNDDSVEGTDENVGGADELVELQLTSSVEAQSRTTHGLDQQIAEGETVHVWVDDAVTGNNEYAGKAMTVESDGSLTGGEAMYFPSNGNPVNIYAVHGNFGDADLSASFWDATVTHSVEQDQRSSAAVEGGGYAVSDLVYCEKAAVGRTANAVGLAFNHLLSKVEVVLKASGVSGISKMEIYNTQLQAEFTPVKESDFTVTATGATGVIVMDNDVTADEEVLNEAVIVPQTVEGGTQLICITTSAGEVYAYTPSEDVTFESGKKYHYTITVRSGNIDVRMTVGDWEEGSETNAAAETIDYYTTTDSGGTTTYVVYNEAGLQAWSEYTRDGNWSTNCTLAVDITMTSGNYWTAVGTYETQYTGTFDGSGCTISGLAINIDGCEHQGLIGYIGSGGEVKNLTLEDVVITCTDGVCIGAVAGINNGTITNCTVSGSGTVSGYTSVGGVVGWNDDGGTVTGCCVSGTVSGYTSVGGVVGWNYNGSVTGCYSMGTVSGTSETGGVVGRNYTYGTVTACYATGKVSGNSYVGGVVGRNDNSVSTCYWHNNASYGIGSDSSDTTNAIYVDGTDVTWTIAAAAMNEVLTGWKYVENDDTNEPLKLASTE